MAKKRLTRKQLLKEPDEFITTTSRVVSWARDNSKLLIYGCAGFFSLVVLVAAINYYQQRQARAASQLLGQSSAKYQAELAKGPADMALAAVRDDFEGLIDTYGGQSAGRLGRVVFAHICLAGEAYDDALTHYKRALNDFQGDPSLNNVILNGIGAALQQKGDTSGALSYYRRLVDADSSVLEDSALFNLGVLYDRLGKPDEGKKAYERLATDFPDSMYASIARERI